MVSKGNTQKLQRYSSLPSPPSEVITDENKEKFYDQIQNVLDSIPGENIKIVFPDKQ